MEKKIIKENAYYKIYWSQPNMCSRHTVTGIPGMPGIALVFTETRGVRKYLLLYACWKSGIRNGVRDLLDPMFTSFPEMIKMSEKKELMFQYSVIDTTPQDMQDIMYWLMKEYQPELNNIKEFADSERYRDIYLKEEYEKKEEMRKISS